MTEIDLEKLVEARESDEDSLLFVGEFHFTDAQEEMLDILQAYRPDTVAIEEGDTWLAARVFKPMMRKIRRRRMKPDRLETYKAIGANSASGVSIVYSQAARVPLYYADLQPRHPGALEPKTRRTISDHLHYDEQIESVHDLLAAVYGPDAVPEQRGISPWWLTALQAGVPREDRMDFCDYMELMSEPKVIELRNIYSARALENIPGERILYVGGARHMFSNEQPYVSVPDLVRADNKLMINLWRVEAKETLEHYGVDRYPIEIGETLEPHVTSDVIDSWDV